LKPIYNILLIALDPEEGEIEFDGNIWPPEPSLEGFRAAVTQEARYLEDFWHQFGNSLPREAARLACAAVRELDAVLFVSEEHDQWRDILIAETAIKNSATLVSDDCNLCQVVSEFGGCAIESTKLTASCP
jgi:hypothetical protein